VIARWLNDIRDLKLKKLLLNQQSSLFLYLLSYAARDPKFRMAYFLAYQKVVSVVSPKHDLSGRSTSFTLYTNCPDLYLVIDGCNLENFII